MKRIITLKAIILGAAFFFTSSTEKVNAQQGSVWVKVPSANTLGINSSKETVHTNSADLNALIQNFSVTAMYPAFPSSRNVELQKVYQLDCACDENDLLAAVASLKDIMVSPELGPHYEGLNTPDDYYLNFQNDYALNLIQAQGAWNYTDGASSVVIAITDSNYDFLHEEFEGKLVFRDTTLTNSNTAHGTAVAITAAGRTNNNAGKSSIGFNSSLQLRGMNYNELLNATYSGAKVVNASWVSGCSFSTYGQQVVNEVFNNGTLIVASAGNGSTCNGASNLVYPASFENVLSVTSIGPNDNHERVIGNSATTHQHNAMVDLSAPGYNVAISSAAGVYITGSGSSYAAAYVSGAAALILSVKPCLSVSDLTTILKSSADAIDSLNTNYAGLIGTGRLNAEAAIELALTYTTLTVQSSVERVCENSIQTIALEPASGDAPYSVIWADGNTSLNYPATTSGDYIYTVIDANGCSVTDTVTVDPFSSLSFDAAVTQIECNGAQNGNIDIFVTGGVGEYTYDWSNAGTSHQISNLNAGIYSVVITDAMGCAGTESFEITEPTLLSGSVNQTNVVDGTLGAIDITVEGGTANYTYLWNNNATTEDLNDLSAGYYEVIVFDANNCSIVLGTTILSTSTEVTDEQLIEITAAENTAGIEQEEMSSIEFNVYPNPANAQTTISWNGIEVEKMHIKDMNGRIVKEMATDSNAINVMLTDFSAGVYLIVLETATNQTSVKRLIVN